MKFFLVLMLIVSTMLPGFAQREFGNKALAMPHFDNNLKKGASGTTSKFNVPPIDFSAIILPSSSFSPPGKPLSRLKRIGETADNNFMKKKKFETPDDIYRTKFNEKLYNENLSITKGDKYLGDFRTRSTLVKIVFWDYDIVDWDMINVYINGARIASSVILTGNSQSVEIRLDKGFNKIEIEALNQGDSGGNTAKLQMYDEKDILVFDKQWGLLTGDKAAVVIVKE